MDLQTIVNIIVGAIIPSGLWMAKRHAEHVDNFNAFRVKVAEQYVTHDDLADIRASLRRIEDKLDLKEDKS